MCGEVATVRALFPDTLHVSLQFLSGAIASLTVSLSSPPLKFREAGGPQVVYQSGGVRFDPHMEHLDVYWQHFDDEEPHLERFDDLGFDHAYRQEFGDFVRWVVDENYQPCLTWREGLRCVEVMEAAARSADEAGSILKLPLYPELEKNT